MITTTAPSFVCEQDRIKDIHIRLVWHSNGAGDWSIAIDGEWVAHIGTAAVETLVECKLIVAETSMTNPKNSSQVLLA
jgi:hypothetical protein